MDLNVQPVCGWVFSPPGASITPFRLTNSDTISLPMGFLSSLLLLEEDEVVSIGISEHELAVPRRLLLRLALGLHAIREERLVEVLDVIDLDVEVHAGSLVRSLGLLGDKGHEEPVHVERDAILLLLAPPEAEGLVELAGPCQVLHVVGDAGDAVHLDLAHCSLLS